MHRLWRRDPPPQLPTGWWRIVNVGPRMHHGRMNRPRVLDESQLTDPERGLLAAVGESGAYDAWGPESQRGQIRGEALLLALGRAGSEDGPSTLAVGGAEFTGPVDASDMVIDASVQFADCVFNGPLVLDRCRSRTMLFVRCSFNFGIAMHDATISGAWGLTDAYVSHSDETASPALLLTGSTIEGPLLIHSTRVAGQAQLVGMSITGRLALDESRLHNPSGVALGLDGSSIAGSLYGRGLDICGEFRGLGMTVGGSIDLDGSALHNPDGPSLALDGANVQGAVHLSNGFRAEGSLRLIGARITQQLIIDNAGLASTTSPAIIGDDLRLGGSLRAGPGTSVEGGARFRRARFDGSVVLAGGRYRATRLSALSFSGAEIAGSLHAEGAQIDGGLQMVGARVSGDVELTGARIRNPAARSVNLDRTRVGGNLNMNDGFQATGEINLTAIRVEGGINLQASHVLGSVSMPDASVGILGLRGASITATDGYALAADRAAIPRGVHAAAASFVGEVRMPAADIGGQLSIADSRLSAPGGVALNIESATVRGSLQLQAAPGSEGFLNLAYASADVLVHRPEPKDGLEPGLLAFTYRDVLPAPSEVPVEDRIRWIRSHPTGYVPSAYSALAAAYESAGHPKEADAVRIAGERERCGRSGLLGRSWGFAKDLVVSHGFRPERALLWLSGWLALGTAALWWMPGGWRHFQLAGQPMPADTTVLGPALYLLDGLIPVLELSGTDDVGIPSEGAQVFVAVYLLVGLLLGIAALAGIVDAVVQRRRG